MSHPYPQAPTPDGDRPGWYSTPPRDERGARPPATAPPRRPMPDLRPPAPAGKPYSPGLAGLGWVLTTLFGLAFIVLFFAGVSAFNSTADGADGARTLGAFIGFALILILPAIPVFIGLRLIRQPRRPRPPR